VRQTFVAKPADFGKKKREARSWELERRKKKLEARSWELERRKKKLEARSWELERSVSDIDLAPSS